MVRSYDVFERFVYLGSQRGGVLIDWLILAYCFPHNVMFKCKLDSKEVIGLRRKDRLRDRNERCHRGRENICRCTLYMCLCICTALNSKQLTLST
ncbi:hypothetical protein Peur_031267 [Populus x canadensis]